MEEQTSWKSHAFTLMIFVGIVVLCSIFFVLGMLVGRTQTFKMAANTAEAAPKPQIRELPQDQAVNKDVAQPKLDLVPVNPAPKPTQEPAPAITAAAPEPAAKTATLDPPPPAPQVPPAITINLQVAALKNQLDAEKQVDDLKKLGFRAFILTPASDDPNPFYRVQIGASDRIDAESLKGKLEAAGYHPILKQ